MPVLAVSGECKEPETVAITTKGNTENIENTIQGAGCTRAAG